MKRIVYLVVLTLCLTFAFLDHDSNGVALNPELNLNDGKHPNIKGVEVIAKNIFPIIQDEILKN